MATNADRIDSIALVRTTPARDLEQWTYGEQPEQYQKEARPMEAQALYGKSEMRDDIEKVLAYMKEKDLGPDQFNMAYEAVQAFNVLMQIYPDGKGRPMGDVPQADRPQMDLTPKQLKGNFDPTVRPLQFIKTREEMDAVLALMQEKGWGPEKYQKAVFSAKRRELNEELESAKGTTHLRKFVKEKLKELDEVEESAKYQRVFGLS
jgi:hypothetical protein